MKQFTGFQVFVGIIIAIVVATTVVGLFLAGSPVQERMRRMDTQRANNLMGIASSIDSYYNQYSRLPDALDILQKTPGFYVDAIVDPETGVPYEYKLLATDQYQICATFQSDATVPGSANAPYAVPTRIGWPDFSRHQAGRICYSITAQKISGKTP